MELKQTQKLSQVLSLTPLMKQSLQILQLPLLDLKGYLESQMEENPVLEYASGTPEEKPPSPSETMEKLWEVEETYADYPLAAQEDEEDYKQRSLESAAQRHPTLQEHLLKQMKTFPLNEKQTHIAEFIIGNIDENGYCNLSTKEITRITQKEWADKNSGEPISIEDAEDVLSLIQRFDPPGVGARNLKECLLNQLQAKNRQNSLAYQLIKNHLSSLANNDVKSLAKKVKADPEDILKAKKEITMLLPKPGAAYKSGIPHTLTNSAPDIILQKHNNKIEIIVNTQGLPRLRVNAYYKTLLRAKDTPPHIRKYLSEKVTRALGILKALAQREETIKRIVQEIMTVQSEFFENHDPSLLKPMLLKDIAHKVQRNESTVSRVINSKYMETPYGTYRLDYFFNKSLPTAEGNSVSQEYIKSRLFTLISEESNGAPLTDTALGAILNKEGVHIARRTVAKYREELKIPPAHVRKRNVQ